MIQKHCAGEQRMDVRENVRKELSYSKEEIHGSGQNILQEVTRTLADNEWDIIEEELKRAIR